MSARRSATAKRFFKPNESRRGFIRVDCDPGSKVAISLPGGASAFDALDLSVYGISFLASSSDVERFSIGMELPSIKFTIGDRPIQVGGKVAYLRTGLVAGLAKIAVEFIDIPIDDVWFLSRFVAEKSGVNKPRQIGTGAIDLHKLGIGKKRRKTAKKAKARPKARVKPKSKARKKARARKPASRKKK